LNTKKIEKIIIGKCELSIMSHENQENEPTTFIYRFKFTPNFTQLLFEFSKMHQYDDRHAFREAWGDWMDKHDEEIITESRYLSNLGYQGNIPDKMYKSSRYYFRTKTTAKVEPKKRRDYVSMDRDLLDNMDNHITNAMKENEFCPASGYDNFCLTYTGVVMTEVERLLSEGLDCEEIKFKLKKTYKNRYFQISHK
jgi:hypothetical protein